MFLLNLFPWKDLRQHQKLWELACFQSFSLAYSYFLKRDRLRETFIWNVMIYSKDKNIKICWIGITENTSAFETGRNKHLLALYISIWIYSENRLSFIQANPGQEVVQNHLSYAVARWICFHTNRLHPDPECVSPEN